MHSVHILYLTYFFNVLFEALMEEYAILSVRISKRMCTTVGLE